MAPGTSSHGLGGTHGVEVRDVEPEDAARIGHRGVEHVAVGHQVVDEELAFGQAHHLGLRLGAGKVEDHHAVDVADEEVVVTQEHPLGGRQGARGGNHHLAAFGRDIEDIALPLVVERIEALGAEVGDQHAVAVGIGALAEADAVAQDERRVLRPFAAGGKEQHGEEQQGSRPFQQVRGSFHHHVHIN